MGSLPDHDMERCIASALEREVAVPTPGCVGEETLWDFAEMGGAHPEAQYIIAHVASCHHCYQGLSRMAEFKRISAAPVRIVVTPEPSLAVRFQDWLKAPRVHQSLHAGGMSLAAALAVFFLTSSLMRNQTAHLVGNRDARIKSLRIEIAAADMQASASQAALRRLENQKALPSVIPPELQNFRYIPMKNNGVDSSQMADAGGYSKEDPLLFALSGPLPGATVRNDSVKFQWEPYTFTLENGSRKRAGSYVVECFNSDDAREEAIRSEPLASASWTPPPQKRPLPGRNYTWMVLAYKDTHAKDSDSVQSPQGNLRFQFRTLSQIQLDRLAANRDSSLTLAALLADLGMWQESTLAYQTYLIAAPNDSRAVHGLAHVRQKRADDLRALEARLQAVPRLAGDRESAGVRKLRKLIAAELNE